MARLYDRVLITVGNNTYHPCGRNCKSQPLKGAVNDSKCFGDRCRKKDWLVISAQNVQDKKEMLDLARQANQNITLATSLVVFHYSGHSEGRNGGLELWMCGVDNDEKDASAGRCHCTRGQNPEGRLDLHDFLKELWKHIGKNARIKLLVLLDCCRGEDGQSEYGNIELLQRESLKGVQILMLYACGRGRHAGEVDISGLWHGIFTLAFLNCMGRHETLAALIDDTFAKAKRISYACPWLQQDCTSVRSGSWEDLSSTPNFFKDQHVPEVREDCEKTEAELQETQWRLSEADRQIASLTSEKEKLEAECTRLEDELEQRKKDSEVDQQEIDRLTNELGVKQEQCHDIKANLDKQTDQKNELEIKCRALNEQLQAKMERLEKLTSDNTELHKSSDEKQRELDRCKLKQVKIENLNSQLRQDKDKLSRECREKDENEGNLRAQIAQLKKQNVELQQKPEQQQLQESARLKSENSDLRQRNSDLSQRLAEVSREKRNTGAVSDKEYWDGVGGSFICGCCCLLWLLVMHDLSASKRK